MSDPISLESLDARLLALETLPTVKVKFVRAGAKVPQYMTDGAAALDLAACIGEPIQIGVAPVAVPTGIAIELPPGYEGQVRPRGSTPGRGLDVANSPGTVDADYRGEVMVILRSLGGTVEVKPGERIAQLVVARAVQAKIEVIDELSETVRGEGAFASTGV